MKVKCKEPVSNVRFTVSCAYKNAKNKTWKFQNNFVKQRSPNAVEIIQEQIGMYYKLESSNQGSINGTDSGKFCNMFNEYNNI